MYLSILLRGSSGLLWCLGEHSYRAVVFECNRNEGKGSQEYKTKIKMDNYDLKSLKELKATTEKYILKMCQKFQEDTGLEINNISLTTIDPALLAQSQEQYEDYLKAKPKLVGIKLTVEL